MSGYAPHSMAVLDRIARLRDDIVDELFGPFGECVPSGSDRLILHATLDGHTRSYELTVRERLT